MSNQRFCFSWKQSKMGMKTNKQIKKKGGRYSTDFVPRYLKKTNVVIGQNFIELLKLDSMPEINTLYKEKC